MTELDIPASFWNHVDELRRMIILCVAVIAMGVCCALFFHQELFAFLTNPLEQQKTIKQEEIRRVRIVNAEERETLYQIPEKAYPLAFSPGVQTTAPKTYLMPQNGFIEYELPVSMNELAIFSPLEGMLTTFKMSLWTGLVATSPLWLFLVLRFIAPALKPRESSLVVPFLFFSLLFLFSGMIFAFYMTIPLANNYLYHFNTTIGNNLWSLSNYLDYTIVLVLANGLAFEISVILFFLVHYGFVTAKSLASKRRVMILSAFILAALLTPPDVLTQFMLAIPLILFYEAAILYALFREKVYKNPTKENS